MRCAKLGLVWTVAALLWPGGEAAAQGAPGWIAGVVQDGEGRPVAHARVLLLPGERQVETGSDGRFELRRVGEGVYRVEVSLIGYAPVSRGVAVRGGAGAEVVVMLAATPLTLSGLQVTASPGARQPTAVMQATTQLSGRALDRELGGSIAQTLRNQPGIAVRSMGPGATMPVIRGLTGDRVLVLQDGQRAGDLAGSADDHGVTIDPLTAQRVEVVRGPATLLYGNNALGGVVNVISGDVSGGVPLRPEVAVAAQTESAFPGGALSVRALTPVGSTWAVTARASARSTGDVRLAGAAPQGRRLDNTHAGSRTGSVAVSHTAAAWSGSLAVRAYDFAYGLPAPAEAAEVTLEGRRAELAGRAEVALPARLFPSVRLDFTAQDYGHDELDDEGELAQRFALRTGAFNVLLRQAAAGNLGDGALGASLLLKEYSATGPSALTPPAVSRALGVFGFQEALLGRGVSLQFGARADRYAVESRGSAKFGAGVSRSFDAFSGSAGVRVPLAGALSASLTAARSFRAPTVEELFSAAPHAGTGSVEFGDVGLHAERGRSLELLLHLAGARAAGQFAAWTNRVDNLVHLAFVGDTIIDGATLPVYRYAQAPATLRGAEAAVELAVTRRVAVGARADWLRAEQADGTPLSFMPPPRLGASLRWDDGRWSAGAELHHDFAQTRTGDAEEGPTDAHTILRLDGGVRMRVAGRPHALTVRIDNLSDQLYHEATSRIRDFAPAPGRNVALLYRAWF